jgi:hypothetical protein
MKTQNKQMLKRIKAVRGIERKRHFENGGTLIEWRGGTRTVTKNKKKEASKQACRQRFR